MKTRDVLLAAVILSGFLLLTKAAQVALTPEFGAWVAAVGPALAQSAGVKFLVVAFAILSFVSLLAAGFDASAKRHARWEAEQARARALREARVRQALTDQFNEPTDRGPWAA